MAAKFMNQSSKEEFLRRLTAIQEDTPQQWGKMNAARVTAHLLHVLRVSLGEVECNDEGGFFMKTVMRFMAFHTPMPWPKGKIETAPGFAPEPEGTFEEQKKNLLAALERFVEASEKDPDKQTVHPAFGMQTLRYWQRLHGRHFEHHLQQFGV